MKDQQNQAAVISRVQSTGENIVANMTLIVEDEGIRIRDELAHINVRAE